MRPRIAIPMPHSSDREYGERAIPQYERAVAIAGGEPVRIELNQSSADIKNMAQGCEGLLLPGSNADVDPAKFGQRRSALTAAADPLREKADFLLLDEAQAANKPVLCICYGLQSLNVFHGGSLIQHIPDFLPEQTSTKVNHEAGRKVAVAHSVEIAPNSVVAKIVGIDPRNSDHARIILPVNSSHHQSADAIGSGLRLVARCPEDGIIEALEGTSENHFVLAVQWHPERSVGEDEASQRIFRALIDATQKR
jgi:putative glutamine amidotransferase